MTNGGGASRIHLIESRAERGHHHWDLVIGHWSLR